MSRIFKDGFYYVVVCEKCHQQCGLSENKVNMDTYYFDNIPKHTIHYKCPGCKTKIVSQYDPEKHQKLTNVQYAKLIELDDRHRTHKTYPPKYNNDIYIETKTVTRKVFCNSDHNRIPLYVHRP